MYINVSGEGGEGGEGGGEVAHSSRTCLFSSSQPHSEIHVDFTIAHEVFSLHTTYCGIVEFGESQQIPRYTFLSLRHVCCLATVCVIVYKFISENESKLPIC